MEVQADKQQRRAKADKSPRQTNKEHQKEAKATRGAVLLWQRTTHFFASSLAIILLAQADSKAGGQGDK
eukprot:834633-Pelagomonas_calceolata.AAC.1